MRAAQSFAICLVRAEREETNKRIKVRVLGNKTGGNERRKGVGLEPTAPSSRSTSQLPFFCFPVLTSRITMALTFYSPRRRSPCKVLLRTNFCVYTLSAARVFCTSCAFAPVQFPKHLFYKLLYSAQDFPLIVSNFLSLELRRNSILVNPENEQN